MTATILLVVLPVFALILVGNVLRRRGFPGDDFWAPVERLVYWVLFPALLVTTLAEADFTRLAAGRMVVTIVTAILVMTAITLALRPILGVTGPTFTSVYQGTVRMNAYIGLSVALGVYGTEGLAAAALTVAAFVPLVNVLGVLILARYGSNAQPGLRRTVVMLARNPLIVACALGGSLNLTGIGLPPVIGPVLDILSRAALPLGLLAVGAALNLGAVRRSVAIVLGTSALKLLGLPALAALGVWLVGLRGVEAFVALLFAALPTATSSYILARQLGGDAPLMANLVTVQTLASLLTLPVVLSLAP